MYDPIKPLSPPYEPEVDAQLRSMMPEGVEPIGLFRTFAKNLPMARAMQPWGTYELGRHFSLGVREREIVIDRTCARCGCDYEWGVHVAYFSEKAGLTAPQVASLAQGSPADPCWVDERDRLLVRMVDALHERSRVDDALARELREEFTEPQLLDLLLLCGWYHGISFAARFAATPPEPWAPLLSDA